MTDSISLMKRAYINVVETLVNSKVTDLHLSLLLSLCLREVSGAHVLDIIFLTFHLDQLKFTESVHESLLKFGI